MSFIRSATSVNPWNTTTSCSTTGPSAWKYSWCSMSGSTTNVDATATIVNGAFSGASATYEMHWSTATERAQYGHYYYTTIQVKSCSSDETISNGTSYSLVSNGGLDSTFSRAHVWRLGI